MYKQDNTLFDEFVIPEKLDKDLLIDNLLMELAELNCIYTRPTTLKHFIGRWSKRRLPIWEKMLLTTLLEYNPIENYDRIEDTTNLETRDLSNTNTKTRDLKEVSNLHTKLDGTDTETRDLSDVHTLNRELTEHSTRVDDLTELDTFNRNLEERGVTENDLKNTNQTTRNLTDKTVENSNTTTKNDETRDLTQDVNRTRDLYDVTDEGSDSKTNTKNSGNDETIERVAAFNTAEDLVPRSDTLARYGKVIDEKNEFNHDIRVDYKGTERTVTNDSGLIQNNGSNNTDHDATFTQTGTLNDVGTQTGTVTNTLNQRGGYNDTIKNTGSVENNTMLGGTQNDVINNTGQVEHVRNEEGQNTNDIVQTGSVHDVSTDSGTVKNTIKGRVHGNIGVTTTQQMIQSEREVAQFDIYNFIIQDFKMQFMIRVY